VVQDDEEEEDLSGLGDESNVNEYNWSQILAFRLMARRTPKAIDTLGTAEAAIPLPPRRSSPDQEGGQKWRRGASPDGEEDQWRRRDRDGRRSSPSPDAGEEKAWRNNALKLPERGENAYRVGAPSEDLTVKLQRTINSLLNKICPENIDNIAKQLQEIEVKTCDELSLMVSLVMKKALAEPHYCETYADLVYKLFQHMPSYPSRVEGEKAHTVKSTLLNLCQDEFESMPRTNAEMEAPAEIQSEGPGEVDFWRSKQKKRMMANMKFIGHLFLRQLLTAKTIGTIVLGLLQVGDENAQPAEHIVECTCELIMAIGATLELLPIGKAQLVNVIGCLTDLKAGKDSNGKGRYSKRIQFTIQDLLDARKAGWAMKSFKAAAKTKEEIRLDQSREISAQAAGKVVNQGGERVQLGLRPDFIQPKSK
jgi:hypothetical protein